MDAISNTSVGPRQLACITVFMLFSATLPGCMTAELVDRVSKGEPQNSMMSFVLTVSDDVYEINRLWGLDQEATVSILRSDLPAGCDTVSFFLNGSSNELQVAQRAYTQWNTGGKLPLPDEIYQPCALLVSYGSFSESPESEGVFITSVAGLVSTGKRQQPHPVAAWTLAPVGMVAEAYIIIGAVWALPVLLPTALVWDYNDRQQKEKARSTLPEPVVTCWTAIDGEMKKRMSGQDFVFVSFTWVSDRENSYVFRTEEGEFSDNKPVPIDTRVTLSHGRVQFHLPRHNSYLSTDANAECGLQAGDVVATFVELRK